MRSSMHIGLALVVSACGGKEVVSAEPSTHPSTAPMDAGADGGGASSRLGPIDASGLPSEVVMTCEGKTQITLKLPCSVGLDSQGGDGIGENVTECELSSQPAVLPAGRPPVLSLIMPLKAIADRLNEPFAIPGDIPPAPSLLTFDGESFTMTTMEGTATFSQIDPARAFVGQLRVVKVQWDGAAGGVVVCNANNQPFWGLRGNFL
jgi:hypothetical protein